MRVIPKVQVVEEIPQWIVSSDTAAYVPRTQTIYLREDQGAVALVHELGHHLIHLFHGKWKLQTMYDKLWSRVIGDTK